MKQRIKPVKVLNKLFLLVATCNATELSFTNPYLINKKKTNTSKRV